MTVNNLSLDDLLAHLTQKLTECDQIVSVLGQHTGRQSKTVRRLRNDLLFARAKVRNLSKELADAKRPIDSFLGKE